MSFLSPAYFWAFLSLLPLIAVYFLKVRPRRKATPAFFLWEKVFEEKKTSSLFSRLRDFWSLLIMLIAFSAVALALTGPELADDERRDLIILVDQSVSMRAGNRIEEARDQARRIVQGMNGTQRAAVAGVSTEVLFFSHLTDHPRELLDAINRIEATDLPLNPEALRSLSPPNHSEAASDWGNRHRVLFLTDGNSSSDVLLGNMERVKVGDPIENMGLVAADMQVYPGSTDRLGFYYQVASSFSETVEVDLILRREGSEVIQKLIPLSVQPGVNLPEVYTLEDSEPGMWTAELDLEDLGSKDNIAYLVAQKPEPIRVKVDTEDRYFFENSVAAFSEGSGLLTLVDENPQLVISKITAPDAPLALIFQPDGASPWWSNMGDELDIAIPRVLVKDHPALRHLDATLIPFVGAREMTAPEDALILVASLENVPLIYQVRSEGKAALVVNMDPLLSEFYFSAWFPVLVHGASTYLAGREEELLASYSTGSTVPIPGGQDEKATRIITPAGAQSELKGKTYGPLEEVGFHHMINATGDSTAAASVLSVGETLLNNEQVKDTSHALSQGQSPALLLTVLAILLLVIESLLYHRRKVG